MPLRNCFALLVLLLAVKMRVAAPASLRCDGSENPTGIDTAQPQLSWILQSDDPSERGIKQTAYQISRSIVSQQVGKSGCGSLDSQRVASGRIGRHQLRWKTACLRATGILESESMDRPGPARPVEFCIHFYDGNYSRPTIGPPPSGSVRMAQTRPARSATTPNLPKTRPSPNGCRWTWAARVELIRSTTIRR